MTEEDKSILSRALQDETGFIAMLFAYLNFLSNGWKLRGSIH